MQIKCIGQLTIDDIVLPDGTVHMETMGGNAMYSTAGAALWLQAGEVMPVSCAGKDYPEHFTHFLQSHGVDCSDIQRTDQEHMRSWVLYEKNRERRCLCRNHEVLPYPPISEESFHEYFTMYLKLHQQGSPLIDNFPDCLNADAYHLAPQSYEHHISNVMTIREYVPGALISLDPSPFYMKSNSIEQMENILQYVDMVLPSREELFSCFGEISPEAAARRLCSMGPSIAVIKLGADGAYVYNNKNDRGIHIPSVSTEVIDTTGAGDSFCGGFLAGFCKTGDVVYAACCGAVSASYAVADYGPVRLFAADRGEAMQKQKNLYEQIVSG